MRVWDENIFLKSFRFQTEYFDVLLYSMNSRSVKAFFGVSIRGETDNNSFLLASSSWYCSEYCHTPADLWILWMSSDYLGTAFVPQYLEAQYSNGMMALSGPYTGRIHNSRMLRESYWFVTLQSVSVQPGGRHHVFFEMLDSQPLRISKPYSAAMVATCCTNSELTRPSC